MRPLPFALASACLLAAQPAAAQAPADAPSAAPPAYSCADILAMDAQKAMGALYFAAGWRLAKSDQAAAAGSAAPAAHPDPAAIEQTLSTARLEQAGTAGALVATTTRQNAASSAGGEAAADSESTRGPADEGSQPEIDDAKKDIGVTDTGAALPSGPDSAPGTAGGGSANTGPAPAPAVGDVAASANDAQPDLIDIPVEQALALCRDKPAMTVAELLNTVAPLSR